MQHIKIEAPNDISNLEYNKICRACLSQAEDLESIFSKKIICDKEITIVEMITACACVQIFEGDGLPFQVCSNCFNRVLQAYIFKQQCEKADLILRDYKYKTITNYSHFLEDTSSAFYSSDDNTKVFKEDSEMCYQNGVDSDKLNRKAYEKNNCKFKTSEKNSKPVICKECGNMFENNKILKEHRKEKHPRNQICAICSKSFNVWKMATHMRSHTQEKPFACDICGSKFNVKCNLKRHMMRHTGERPHKCPICNKGFIQASSLTEHLKVHNDETPSQCTISSKSCTQSDQLCVHVKKNNESKSDIIVILP